MRRENYNIKKGKMIERKFLIMGRKKIHMTATALWITDRAGF